MEGFYAAKAMSLKCIHQIKSKLVEVDDLQTYDKFKYVLQQYGSRKIDSSMAISTVRNLFQNYPDLFHLFKPFVPAKYSAAATSKKAVDLKSSIDFVNRVRNRFDGNHDVYRGFIGCLYSYSQGELSVSEVFNKVVGLFRHDKDLAAEFVSFLPQHSGNIQETSRKRKISPTSSDEQIKIRSTQEQRKKRVYIPSNHDEEKTKNKPHSINNRHNEETPAVAPPRLTTRQVTRNLAAESKIGREDFEMEDELTYVEVQVSNLNSTYEKGVDLMCRLLVSELSSDNVCLDEHFTQLNLGCIRRLDSEFLKRNHENDLVFALSELNCRLKKKIVLLEKSRAKLQEKWFKIRQSCRKVR